MLKRVVVAIDGLTGHQRQRIVSHLDRWAVVDFVPEKPNDWSQALAQAEVVFGWPAPSALEHSQVRFFQLPSSGYEQYMTEALTGKCCFRLANSRGVAAVAVAEHCLAMMFAFARQVALHARQQEQHHWQRATHYSVLAGSSVAIVGLGAIGRALAERCHALGMHVTAVGRNADVPNYLARFYALQDLHTALRNVRHVVLTMAALARSTPLFGAAEFNAMASESYFYNMSRGSLVDQDALQAALRDGRLAGAGLDVFAQEPLPATSALWDLKNVLVSPHVGGRFAGEVDGLIDLFLHNLQQYRDGKPITNLVIDTHDKPAPTEKNL
jgi:phosphoglycerate dehydrogenase-like enzyme